jgi:hypothetical protein
MSIMARLDKIKKLAYQPSFPATSGEVDLSAEACAATVPPSFENWLSQPTVIITPEMFLSVSGSNLDGSGLTLGH